MAICTSGRAIPDVVHTNAPCGRELTELPYTKRDGSDSVCLVCPRCDGPIKPAA